jgi:hypothetical protein
MSKAYLEWTNYAIKYKLNEATQSFNSKKRREHVKLHLILLFYKTILLYLF